MDSISKCPSFEQLSDMNCPNYGSSIQNHIFVSLQHTPCFINGTCTVGIAIRFLIYESRCSLCGDDTFDTPHVNLILYGSLNKTLTPKIQ